MILNADCIEAMAEMDADSVDAIVCDPPYGLGFMGKEWDEASRLASVPPSGTPDTPLGRFNTGKGPAAVAFDGHAFQAWSERWATEALRILKPGAHLLAFGGTRTYHRLACAIEDAGFEIRDSLIWIYGSGFPKSLDVSKAVDARLGAEREITREATAELRPGEVVSFDQRSSKERERRDIPSTAAAAAAAAAAAGWGTALKPAHEPIVVGRKPLAGTVAQNWLEHGTGALNIDGCRVAMSDEDADLIRKTARPNSAGELHEGDVMNRPATPTVNVHDAGRWPANIILSEQAAVELDEQSGELTSGKLEPHHADNGKDSGTLGAFAGSPGRESYGDTGGASRFFYCAKASSAERNAGLRGFEEKPTAGAVGMQTVTASDWGNPDEPTYERTTSHRNVHPTVKPIALMRWLVRLVTPPGGTVLDPFTGSGTTGAAAALEGFDFIGIEREAEYAAIAEARVKFWAQFPGADVDAVLESDARAREVENAGQLGLLALLEQEAEAA